MKYLVRFGSVFLMVLLVGCASQGGGDDSASNMAEGSGGEVQMKSGVAGVLITKPAPMSDVTSPFEVCIDTMGYTVEPAKNGVNEGKGHHHLIIDADLPDLSQPIPKDEQHIHMRQPRPLRSRGHQFRSCFCKVKINQTGRRT
jgi:hypothetical protein